MSLYCGVCVGLSKTVCQDLYEDKKEGNNLPASTVGKAVECKQTIRHLQLNLFLLAKNKNIPEKY